ncbi:hypothetical protein [Ferruginibacter sp.]
MRLIKQSFLYFKEGNSDKVYEIDLCDVGNDKYVVNFRYGRRGAQLKEGSKTPVPVGLAEAEKIYDTIETEKLSKGYTTSESGEPVAPLRASFTLDTNVLINTGWNILPPSRNRSILQRLHSAVNGTAANARFQWKLSRVIWKAGEYKIKEAAPYIIKLFSNGNQLHQYCAAWALVRCYDGSSAAADALRSIYNTHPVAGISKIAGAGLVKHSTGVEKETQLTYYINRLPEDVKKVVEAESETALNELLQLRILQQQPNYKWLEDLYIIAVEKRAVRNCLKKLLEQIPLRPNYFKHIRAIFKLAELLDDHEIVGLLATRFEREEEMFRHNISFENAGDEEIYIPEIEEWVKPQKEFKKSTSRLAYSQKTRWYFHGRVLRQLLLKGKTEDNDYVKLATALLISYKFSKDFKEHYSTFSYVYARGRYERMETRFIENAQAVYLHQVLSGNNPDIILQPNHLWRLRTGNENTVVATSQQKTTTTESGGLGGFIKKLFGKKKEAPPVEATPVKQAAAAVNTNGTPFLHLWNKMPQAYLQLMMEAEMNEVHKFAEENLTIHPEYNTIKHRLDKEAYKQLLLSAFKIPARFGYTLAAEKYSNTIPDDDLALAMLNSINEEARNKGKQWTETYLSTYFQQSHFITALIFAKHAAIRSWSKSLIKNNSLAAEVRNTVVGKSIAELMSYTEQTTANELIIKDAGETLFELFGEELKQLNIGIVADMLQHPNASVLLFGLRLLKAQKQQLDIDSLSPAFLFGLLQHQQELVRAEGIGLLTSMSDDALLRHQDNIIGSCLSPYENVRKGLPPIIERMALKQNAFGIKATENLMPFLLRKETTEGVHADVSRLLCNELSNYLQNANKETALNLLYSNYSAAQNVGVIILEKYTDPSQLTIAQVVALGGHENLNVREWCWKFYKEQSSRIKYEKESSIKLLESKWQDSRQFAMQYFREQFAENDWNPETLITLADSIKPDVEAFGRELITKFFTNENGVQYLLKLSQHPSEKMQLFATNYLQRFATDDAEKIQSLDFYFRSVLTRVNKSRVAKNRIYQFLLEEGRRSEAVAKVVSNILSDVSAIAAIGDKAKCIDILLQLKALYDVATPVTIKETEIRVASKAS